MKFLSTFKITKGFDNWLKMYKEIEPDLNELGIKILWAGTNSDEIKVYDVTEFKDLSKVEKDKAFCIVPASREDKFLKVKQNQGL